MLQQQRNVPAPGQNDFDVDIQIDPNAFDMIQIDPSMFQFESTASAVQPPLPTLELAQFKNLYHSNITAPFKQSMFPSEVKCLHFFIFFLYLYTMITYKYVNKYI